MCWTGAQPLIASMVLYRMAVRAYVFIISSAPRSVWSGLLLLVLSGFFVLQPHCTDAVSGKETAHRAICHLFLVDAPAAMPCYSNCSKLKRLVLLHHVL